MKDLGSEEVYYGVAALTVIILLVYIHAGEVIPLVGFLLSGSLVYALYPHKSVALVAGVVIASLLQLTKKEGFVAGEMTNTSDVMTTETALDDDNNVNLQASVKDEPNPNSPPSGADTAGEITKQAGTPVTAQPVSVAPPVPTNVEPSMMSSSANNAGSLDSSSNSSTTTSAPASARAPATAPPQLTPEQAARQQQNRNQQRINKKLEGLANLNPTDMTSTDMDQLSALIDKTTDLLKMLPEGFLAKASI